jgi:SNF2 family DNA or RNA helicase
MSDPLKLSAPPLEPYQHVGALNLSSNWHHLLADEPGLGKTRQAIHAADLVAARDVLVTCPASVRTVWRDELREVGSSAGWDVISYDEARDPEIKNRLRRREYDIVVLDEAHFLKNLESQRTRAVLGRGGLAHLGDYIWPLTGTPVLNRPRELYPILKTLHPAFADMTFAAYAQRYCAAHFDGYGINTKGASRIDELSGLLQGFMTRRTKREVWPDRVEPIIETVPLLLSPEDMRAVLEEERLISEREAYLSPTREQFGQLGDLARLLRLTGIAKVRATLGYLEDLLETVYKIVVFFHHQEVGRKLEETLAARGYQPVVYQGGMSDRQKDEARRTFRDEIGCRVFLGQIQAAGTGINDLQRVCSDVVFAEQEWVPGSMGQAIGRVDRKGQGSDVVVARILHAEGTLEGALLGSRRSKQAVISRLMGAA